MKVSTDRCTEGSPALIQGTNDGEDPDGSPLKATAQADLLAVAGTSVLEPRRQQPPRRAAVARKRPRRGCETDEDEDCGSAGYSEGSDNDGSDDDEEEEGDDGISGSKRHRNAAGGIDPGLLYAISCISNKV